jgi:DNA topoisomerase VI subunit A
MIHEALIGSQTITKRYCSFRSRLKAHLTSRCRDIYYRDPELFTKQAVVDRYVDDIAYTFGVPRLLLNVVRPSFGWIHRLYRS